MNSPKKETPYRAGDGAFDLVSSAFGALVDTPGRRGVRIFGLPREDLIKVILVSLLLGYPLFFIVAMMSFWDRVGDLSFVKQLNSYLAPPIDALSYEFRAGELPEFPVKRFMIAAISMIELVFLSNFFALFARGVRRHALLVWACYDRKKLVWYSAVSAVVFCSLWYILFFDWAVLAYLHQPRPYRGNLLHMYSILAMPFAAAIFGHMATIVGLGMCRTASQKVRRLRKAFS